MVKSFSETRAVMKKLRAQHPNADTELHYRNAYELLVATILSAQCTDERVNQVTPALFTRYPDPRALAHATPAELEPQIQSTGFFRMKSKALVGMATNVVDRFDGSIPASMEALTALPGVGRKTANVVLGHALGVPGLPVDRHVLRVSNRIGIAESDDPEIVEQQLCAAMPKAEWTRTSDTLILHGRRICKPRPLCEQCAVRDDCDYYRTTLGATAKRTAAKKRPAGRPAPQSKAAAPRPGRPAPQGNAPSRQSGRPAPQGKAPSRRSGRPARAK